MGRAYFNEDCSPYHTSRGFNIKGQQCFQLDLLALWFLPLRGIDPSGMVTSMKGATPLARGKHLAKNDLW